MAVRRVVIAEHRQHLFNRDAWGVERHEDLRLLLVARIIRTALAHQDRDLAARIADARRPPLATVDDVVIALALDAGLDVGRVRRGDRRLRHQEGGADFAVHQRPQPFALLLAVAVADEHFHVAGIGRGAVEHLGSELDAAHMLGAQRVFEVGQAGATELVVLVVVRRHEHVPEALGAGLLLQFIEHRNDLPAVPFLLLLVVGRFRRLDIFLGERDDAVAPVALALGKIEIHGAVLTRCVFERVQRSITRGQAIPSRFAVQTGKPSPADRRGRR